MSPCQVEPADDTLATFLANIRDVGQFETEPGAGVAFQIAIEDAVGLHTQLPAIMKEMKDA